MLRTGLQNVIFNFRVIASYCTNMQFAWLCTIRWHCLWQSAEPFVAGCPSFIQCCVHCCGLRMSHVSLSFQLPSLSGRVVSSQSSFIDRRPMFVLVSLFLVCLPVFLLLSSLAGRITAGIIEQQDDRNMLYSLLCGICRNGVAIF